MAVRRWIPAFLALPLAAFAPQQAPDCPASRQASREFVEGYAQASVALRENKLDDAIALANTLEPLAANDGQRSSLASIRQTAYAGLKDDRGFLTETERQIDLGCLSQQQLEIQTQIASAARAKLGLPPR